MSEHIFAIHDPGAWFGFIRDAGKTGWCVYTEGIGHNPNDHGGGNYEQPGITPIVRLNNAYGSGGCLPRKEHYQDFAQRCANFVRSSKGNKRWIIGNELLQLQWEWPDGIKIEFSDYIQAYNLVYDAIKSVQPDAEIMPQAPATWNNIATYPGNERGDWVKLLADQLVAIGVSRIGGIAVHAYSKGYSPDSLRSTSMMNPPFQDRVFGFGVLWEFMRAIPSSFRHLPVYLTECNGDDRWPDNNTGWVKALYHGINLWNKTPGNQKILCSALFRWAQHDEKWDISRHSGSVDDFRQSLSNDYRHNYVPGSVSNSVRVMSEAGLNLRDKPNGTILEVLSPAAELFVISDIGDWLQVKTASEKVGFVWKEYVG